MQVSKPFVVMLVLLVLLGISVTINSLSTPVYGSGGVSYSMSPTPPPHSLYHEDMEAERTYTLPYPGLATGKRSRISAEERYPWPFTFTAIGHDIESYQNFGGSPYFHHGLDILAPAGTEVKMPTGGTVTKVWRYGSSSLYWEVAILDSQGFIWQFHHVDPNTITVRQGQTVAAGTVIGKIIRWPSTTFGEPYHHIHLNILGAGDQYQNPFSFFQPLNDTAKPEIQKIGLLINGRPSTNTQVSGAYGLFVQARDIVSRTPFYLPPYETTFSVDGGPETTVWRFDNLPGGSRNTAYVHNFFVPSVTCGNYDCRNFYINLGFTKSGNRTFPNTSGPHTIVVKLRDFSGNTTQRSFTWTVIGGPTAVPTTQIPTPTIVTPTPTIVTPTPTIVTPTPTPITPTPGGEVFRDDFESEQGWTRNPNGSDTATLGQWERGDPEATDYSGTKQLGTTTSGNNDLVTGRLAGGSAGAYDLDGGISSIRSPAITLPRGILQLSFAYYLAHASNASTDDYLRVSIMTGIPDQRTVVLEKSGASSNANAAWQTATLDLSAYAGQTIYLLIEAADLGSPSLVEAAVDDIVISGSIIPDRR